MAPAVAAPLLGALGALQSDPAAAVTSALKGTLTYGGIAMGLLAVRGYWLQRGEGSPAPAAFNASGGPVSVLGGRSAPAENRPPRDGGSESSTGPNAVIRGREKVRNHLSVAASQAGVPKSWLDRDALYYILGKESSSGREVIRCGAVNPSSGALGPFQLNPSSGTAQQYGVSQSSKCVEKTAAGLKYIGDRYGSPEAAAAFHRKNGWY